MKFHPKQADEFILDLVEFLGKHFSSAFNKTKMGGGNEGVTVTLKHEACESELEIGVVRSGIDLRLGDAAWRLEGFQNAPALFAKTIADVLDVFQNRIVLVSGFRNGERKASIAYPCTTHPVSLPDIRSKAPGCDRFTIKKWNELAVDLALDKTESK